MSSLTGYKKRTSKASTLHEHSGATLFSTDKAKNDTIHMETFTPVTETQREQYIAPTILKGQSLITWRVEALQNRIAELIESISTLEAKKSEYETSDIESVFHRVVEILEPYAGQLGLGHGISKIASTSSTGKKIAGSKVLKTIGKASVIVDAVNAGIGSIDRLAGTHNSRREKVFRDFGKSIMPIPILKDIFAGIGSIGASFADFLDGGGSHNDEHMRAYYDRKLEDVQSGIAQCVRLIAKVKASGRVESEKRLYNMDKKNSEKALELINGEHLTKGDLKSGYASMLSGGDKQVEKWLHKFLNYDSKEEQYDRQMRNDGTFQYVL